MPVKLPTDECDLRATLIGCAIAGALFARALACQRGLYPLLLARLQIERVTFDVFNDVLLQDLALKALERALQAFAIVELNFSQ